MNPEVTIDHFFNWLPPLVGTPLQYRVAVDGPDGVQIAPPGTVIVTAPTVKVAMNQFLSGQTPADGFLIYVAVEDAAGNVSGFLAQPFKYVTIGTPEPAPEPFTLS